MTSTRRAAVSDANKKLADERADLAAVNAKAGMPLPSGWRRRCPRPRRADRGRARCRAHARACAVRWHRSARHGQGGEVAAPSPEIPVVFGDLSAMKVRARSRARCGQDPRRQRVVGAADAYPDQDFEGRVGSHRPVLSSPHRLARPAPPERRRGVEAMVDLDGLPPLLTGMRVECFFKHDATASTSSPGRRTLPSFQRAHPHRCARFRLGHLRRRIAPGGQQRRRPVRIGEPAYVQANLANVWRRAPARYVRVVVSQVATCVGAAGTAPGHLPTTERSDPREMSRASEGDLS